MARFIDCSHNMLFSLNRDKWNADLAKSGIADLVGYQEAGGDNTRAVLAAWCKAHGFGLYHPAGTSNPIGWKTAVFSEILRESDKKPVQGQKDVHPSAISMGVDYKYNPAGDFTWKGLLHKASGQKILRVNRHAPAGATTPTSPHPPALEKWKNWAAGQYWLDVISFVTRYASVGTSDPKAQQSYWDVILLGGDYNGDLLRQNTDEWYYPSRILQGLFPDDSNVRGLDHLQHMYGGDVKPVRRWSVAGNTDHRIHFITREFVEVTDFPT